MPRPLLTPTLAPETFGHWYWLKQELQAYCRTWQLPAGGSKAELMQRVQAHLAGRPLPAPARTARSAMPAELRPETVVAPGWRLGVALRAFFVQHLGPDFHFDQTLRDFFRDPRSRTLAQALALWQAARQAPPPAIERQFQFNRHVRDYFAQHPGATRARMLQAWRDKRQTPQALVFPAASE